MAKNNVEIEIKFEISSQKFEKARKILQAKATPKYETHQIDRYFNAPHRDFLAPEYPYEYLRIREEKGKALLTYKHMYPEDTKDKTHGDEYEFEVSDGDKLLKILQALGFEEYLTIDKNRKCFVFEDKVEITLDDVKDLGLFIEIEAIGYFASIKAIRSYIFEFAESLGISREEQHFDGLVVAMLKAKGLRPAS